MPFSSTERLLSMHGVDSSGSDLDSNIDLESGGASSEEETSRNLGLQSENLKIALGTVRSGLTNRESQSECTSDEGCSCSYDKFLNSDVTSAKDTELLGKFRQKVITAKHERVDQEKPKKQNPAKPSKPPRPPRGPSLDASDMKLLKEISEVNFKRRRMEKSRTLRRIKKEKTSSSITYLFACLATVVFLLVIIFQGVLGSRT